MGMLDFIPSAEGNAVYGIVETPFGRAVVAATARGVSLAEFLDGDGDPESVLRLAFPGSMPEPAGRKDGWLSSVREFLSCSKDAPVPAIDPRGTPFQMKVWNAIRQIPRGETASYSELARRIGMTDAARAVALTCASNRIAVVIPCHRVVRADGGISGYRWGIARRRAILAAEA